MIVFLTLLWCAVLAVLVRLKVIRLTLFWKLSPLLWMLLLLAVLFVPMQWGAPAAPLNNLQLVVEVIPNVSGEVIEVPVTSGQRVEEGEILFRIDPRPFAYEVERVEASIEEATADRDFAKIQYDRNREAAETSAVAKAELDSWRARTLAAEARIAALGAQLDRARFDLEESVVRAPVDGRVLALTLEVGQRVGSLPMRSWVALVADTQLTVAFVRQSQVRYVRKGQPAEVVLRAFPGVVLPAKVDDVIDMTAGGQLSPSGQLQMPPEVSAAGRPGPFGVYLSYDTEALAALPLPIPGGSTGTAAIYTESAPLTHIIRRVMLRMEAWMNYLIPS